MLFIREQDRVCLIIFSASIVSMVVVMKTFYSLFAQFTAKETIVHVTINCNHIFMFGTRRLCLQAYSHFRRHGWP